jgi:hypothetical protein
MTSSGNLNNTHGRPRRDISVQPVGRDRRAAVAAFILHDEFCVEIISDISRAPSGGRGLSDVHSVPKC